MSKMIPDPEAYFRRFLPTRDPLLEALEEEAVREDIPIVGPVVGRLLYILARTAGARRILELGAATGYSTIFLARACHDRQGKVITIEKDPAYACRAEENVLKAGCRSCVDIRTGDAARHLSRMTSPVDFIFMDIDKEYYVAVLEDCHRLLKPEGLLVADNVGFLDAMAFNESLWQDPRWETVNLYSYLPFHSPEYDGLCLSIRK